MRPCWHHSLCCMLPSNVPCYLLLQLDHGYSTWRADASTHPAFGVTVGKSPLCPSESRRGPKLFLLHSHFPESSHPQPRDTSPLATLSARIASLELKQDCHKGRTCNTSPSLTLLDLEYDSAQWYDDACGQPTPSESTCGSRSRRSVYCLVVLSLAKQESFARHPLCLSQLTFFDEDGGGTPSSVVPRRSTSLSSSIDKARSA